VLTEKLAALYAASGKPSSAIATYQAALKLNPSPQQRIRIHLTLAEKLREQNREADAVDNYRQLIAEAPDYAGLAQIRDQLKTLEQKISAENKK